MSPIVNALKNAEYFITTGEVLISKYEVRQKDQLIIADIEWTFPLDFVEVVWGDGEETGREIVSTTDLPSFSSKRFEIPFDATDKKWVRLAAWDMATNGVLTQPVELNKSVDQ